MKRPTQKLILISILFATHSLFSCSKKNETTLSEIPLTGIGFQNTNLLSDFDPSFESASTTTTPPSNRATTNRKFRVISRSRSRAQEYEVTNVAAFSGQSSLRLFDATEQTLILPAGGNKTTLSLISGARYRVQAFIRLPRNVRNRRAEGEFEVPSLVDSGRLLFQFSGSSDLLVDDFSLFRIR